MVTRDFIVLAGATLCGLIALAIVVARDARLSIAIRTLTVTVLLFTAFAFSVLTVLAY
ncbi:MAG: hypothetical protein GIX01_14665 [Candidatus Eremiobacteraeota bacterium]|nr:hypothetical protein [Candidatus Eremiobacteraeota bacterium]